MIQVSRSSHVRYTRITLWLQVLPMEGLQSQVMKANTFKLNFKVAPMSVLNKQCAHRLTENYHLTLQSILEKRILAHCFSCIAQIFTLLVQIHHSH